MDNFVSSHLNFSLLENPLPARGDLPHPDYEIPHNQDCVERVARPAINQFVDAIQGNTVNQFENLINHDSNLWRRVPIANKELESFQQNDLNPLEEVHAFAKRKMDALEEPIQPSKRSKPGQSPCIEFRLVFRKPNSIGEVFLKRTLDGIFTEDEDKEIINGKIMREKTRQIAERLTEKTTNQINSRWAYLSATHPHLKKIVKRAALEKVNICRLELVKPVVEVDPLSFLVTDPNAEGLASSNANPIGEVFLKRTLDGIFTEDEDKEIINGKMMGEKAREIAKRLPEKTPSQIDRRWRHLRATHPDLEKIVAKSTLENGCLRSLELVKPVVEVDPLTVFMPEPKVVRLVFSEPNSLGEVFLKRGSRQVFSGDEDKVIIEGKIKGKKVREIAKGLPKKKWYQINARWRCLSATNPDLKKIVEKAWTENVRLLGLEPVKPAGEFDPLSFLVPDLRVNPILSEQ